MTVRRRAGQSEDDGFALLVVMGSMTVLTIFLLTTLSYVLQNMAPSRADQDQKAATAAAQAGIEEYVARLNANDTYWQTTDCTNLALVPTPPATCATARPATGVAVPGTVGAGTYSYRLLSTSASTTQDGLVRLAVTGHSRGKKRTLVAELAPTGFLQYIYFTDFESLDPALSTEVADPASESNPSARLNGQKFLKNPTAMTYTFWYPRRSGTAGPCGSQHWYAGRSAPQYSSGKYLEYVHRYTVDAAGNDQLGSRLSGPTEKDASSTVVISDFTCDEIQFADGDKITGPLKTNDAMLLGGAVHFTSPVTETAWATAPDPARPWRGTGTPSAGTSTEPGYQPVVRGSLPMPDSNAELITAATSSPTGCVYTGATRIEFLSDGKMTVRSKGTSSAVPRCYPGGPGPATVDVPSVMYVKESTANCDEGQLGYPLSSESLTQGAGPDYGCKRGNAYVSGVLKGRTTIGTANDIVVVGDTTYAGGLTGSDALGLIPQNFAWIYHPVKSNGTNLLTTPVRRLDAAVLAVQHSFLVQNWRVGEKLSTASDEASKLQVRGAIAQKYRGPVGTGGTSSSGSGYLKAYTYDKRLLNAPPPYFLRPQTSPYNVLRMTD